MTDTAFTKDTQTAMETAMTDMDATLEEQIETGIIMTDTGATQDIQTETGIIMIDTGPIPGTKAGDLSQIIQISKHLLVMEPAFPFVYGGRFLSAAKKLS